MTATIYDADGAPIETKSFNTHLRLPDCPTPPPSTGEAPKNYRLVPEAGKIIVARTRADKFQRINGNIVRGINNEPLEKHPDSVAAEDERNTVAVVVSVGDPDPNNGYVGTWRTGQRVVIQPHVFNEAPGLPEIDGMVALIGSFYGVTARWEEVKDDE